MPRVPISRVGSPLQMAAFYLAWVESAVVAAIFAVGDSWLKTPLVIVVISIAVFFAVMVGYINIHLLRKNPHLLFNPSDYDAKVQPLLFPDSEDVEIEKPPKPGVTKIESGVGVSLD